MNEKVEVEKHSDHQEHEKYVFFTLIFFIIALQAAMFVFLIFFFFFNKEKKLIKNLVVLLLFKPFLLLFVLFQLYLEKKEPKVIHESLSYWTLASSIYYKHFLSVLEVYCCVDCLHNNYCKNAGWCKKETIQQDHSMVNHKEFEWWLNLSDFKCQKASLFLVLLCTPNLHCGWCIGLCVIDCWILWVAGRIFLSQSESSSIKKGEKTHHFSELKLTHVI